MRMRGWILYVGDALLIAALTLFGFVVHGETDVSFLPRMAALYFPLSISWFLLAPALGLFEGKITADPKQLWRPVFAMIFAVPLATVIRGFILNTPIFPIFAAVLAATFALGMVIWRALYLLWNRSVS